MARDSIFVPVIVQVLMTLLILHAPDQGEDP